MGLDGSGARCRRAAALGVQSRVRLAEDSEPYLPLCRVGTNAHCPSHSSDSYRSPKGRQPRLRCEQTHAVNGVIAITSPPPTQARES